LDNNVLTEALNPKDSQEQVLREKSNKEEARQTQITFGNISNKAIQESKLSHLNEYKPKKHKHDHTHIHALAHKNENSKDLKPTIHDHYEDENKKHDENVNGFITHESEEIDHIDSRIDENKHTTRPRINTYDNSNMLSHQIKKILKSDLSHDNIQEKKKKRNRLVLDNNCEHDHSHEYESDPDLEEATLKNVVSSKGKFMSLLQARNMCKNLNKFF
jgi:hypothetical protein